MTTTHTAHLDAIADGRAALALMDKDIEYIRGLGEIQAAESMQILRDGFAQYQTKLEAFQLTAAHEQIGSKRALNPCTGGMIAGLQTVEG